jgi:4,5-DOPA dioxygenase extradiol
MPSSSISKHMPYTESFDEALREAVESEREEREEEIVRLLKRKDARKAHPTFEHLLPIFIGAGAAEDGGGFSWAMFRFGSVNDSF